MATSAIHAPGVQTLRVTMTRADPTHGMRDLTPRFFFNRAKARQQRLTRREHMELKRFLRCEFTRACGA
jgi:hypothetical protein